MVIRNTGSKKHPNSGPVGRAKAVLTLGNGDEAIGVVADIIAVAVPTTNQNMFSFVGTSRFDAATCAHYESVLAPIVRTIGDRLRVSVGSFELSASNVDLAAMQDRSITVSGYSADSAVLVSCVSAMLDIAVEKGLLSTGHVGSTGGRMHMVSNLAAKIRTARENPEVKAFVYPGFATTDSSITGPARDEVIEANEVIRLADDRLSLCAVFNLDDVLRAAFSEIELILSSLKHGYFERANGMRTDVPGICTLAESMNERFWTAAEKALRSGESDVVKALLAARAAFHVRQRRYCPGFGQKLFDVLAGLPPVSRDTRVKFPLLPDSMLASLIKLVTPHEIVDVRILLDAVAGDRFAKAEPLRRSVVSTSNRISASDRLDAILEEIDIDNLSRRIGRPYDEARQTFHCGPIITQATAECIEVVGAFLIHVRQFTDTGVMQPSRDALMGEAVSLLGDAFGRLGGIKAAYAEARDGTRGGLRFVLNQVVDHLKHREMEKHINYVFAGGLSEMSEDEQIDVVSEFVQRLRQVLPHGTITGSSSDYLANAQELIQAYVRATSQVKQMVRAL